MKEIAIINGPNLNLLGVREPSVYGSRSMEEYFEELKKHFEGRASLTYFQNNCEGAIIDEIHRRGFSAHGIVLNAGAYTHTSIALHDCIRSLPCDVVEVHISNVNKREDFRHHSFISSACLGVICGFGLDSYRLAIEALIQKSKAQ